MINFIFTNKIMKIIHFYYINSQSRLLSVFGLHNSNFCKARISLSIWRKYHSNGLYLKFVIAWLLTAFHKSRNV